MTAPARQLPLALESTKQAQVDGAFADGLLRIEIDKPIQFGLRDLSGFAGDGELKTGEHVQLYHVISKSAGGEIRGYFLARGELRLRTPAYPYEWPEVDAAVSRIAGFPVRKTA